MPTPMWWVLLWVMSTLLWAASDRLGLWLVHTVWLAVVVLFFGLAAMRLARGRSKTLRGWTAKAFLAALIATAGGPLTVVALQAIGQRM